MRRNSVEEIDAIIQNTVLKNKTMLWLEIICLTKKQKHCKKMECLTKEQDVTWQREVWDIPEI